MKQFVKAFDKEGKCFEYLSNTFPGISIEKKKMEVFDGPDIKKLVKDLYLIESMNEFESREWTYFKSVIQNFLGNRKANNCKQLVDELI